MRAKKSISLFKGKAFLAVLAVSILLLLASCASTPPLPSSSTFKPGEWEGLATVRTAYGILEGSTDKESTYSWLGIPYAAPPVGDLRWQKPRLPQPWQGVRNASHFGSKAVQRALLTDFPIGSEDCLFLNVWRPATREKKLPVYVWIHGGANTSGSSSSSRNYRGHSLASKANLVFVSVNYRLDVLGWFAHPSLRTGDPETDSGNFGTLDLIASLEWIRDNIEAFGGDSSNVTIAGESAGALNVLTLLMAPKARGLFHKAIAESGYTRQPQIDPVEFAEGIARKLAISQGKAATEKEANEFMASMGKERTAEWLRAAKPGELIQFSKSSTGSILSIPSPIFDGTILPSLGFAALADPSLRADVPLIIGTNKEETKFFFLNQWNKRRSPYYRELVEVTTAMWKAEGADSIADAFDSGSGDRKVYLYRFDWGAPDRNGDSVIGKAAGDRLGACHAIEISFFLQTDSIYGNILPLPVSSKANRKGRSDLEAKIGAYLASFVRTGNPNAAGSADGLPFWEAWDSSQDQPSFIVLDADLHEARIGTEQGRVIRSDILKDVALNSPDAFKEELRKAIPLLE